jgi:hypothetical protein
MTMRMNAINSFENARKRSLLRTMLGWQNGLKNEIWGRRNERMRKEILGERESDSVRLDEAVPAFRGALRELN